MTSCIADKIKKRIIPNDVFLTPLSVIKIHLELIKPYINKNDLWFDPFYGTGNYYNSFPTENKCFTEISLNKDFFDFNEKIDIICSNPPYSCIDKVLEKSVELNPRIISYLIGFGNLTTKRIEYMNKHGYNLVVFHLTKVYKWYGMSLIVVFIKEGTNCISYDRIVHK
jgi:hypothetical protein